MKTLSQLGEQLRTALSRAHEHRTKLLHTRAKQTKVHVAGAGGTLTSAYEQLRNAAENTEEHLLLQNAIRRYYRQIILARDVKLLGTSGEELATELTLAGYVENDSLTTAQIKSINKLAGSYEELLHGLSKHRVPSERAHKWVLDVLSVGVERIISDHTDNDAFFQFCYEYFLKSIDAKQLFPDKVHTDYGTALFIAVHRSLFRSDTAVIRADLISRYQVKPNQAKEFIAHSKHIDKLVREGLTERLYRLVDRQVAPERITRRMLSEDVPVYQLLPHKQQFLNAYEKQIEREYKQTSDRIHRAIIRSIVFLFITKAIIGIAIEIPYDIWVHDEIIWLPLIVNLLFPPLYMALLSLTLGHPGSANTRALVDKTRSALYSDGSHTISKPLRIKEGPSSRLFSVIYSLFAVVVIGLISWGLIAIGFSFLHLLIFFVFLSTASFLGFRLSRMVRELEVVSTNQNGLTFVRDLFYLPFVVIGRWLNEKYAQVNIVTLVLDMAIELPLKTVLRLVRQWAAFINAKKDEI